MRGIGEIGSRFYSNDDDEGHFYPFIFLLASFISERGFWIDFAHARYQRFYFTQFSLYSISLDSLFRFNFLRIFCFGHGWDLGYFYSFSLFHFFNRGHFH